MERQYNLRSPAVKRLMREAQELREPTEIFYAQPLEDNLFEWHFTIRGPAETDFDGGVYHGRIILPPEYPMKPPSIILLTPNGRFELFKKICLSISGHHPESWQPSWSIRTALLAIIGFMPTHGSGAIGALDYTPEERKMLAKKSREFNCSECGAVKDILKPVTEASQSDSQEAKELASQINFQGEKQNGGASANADSSTTSTREAPEPSESNDAQAESTSPPAAAATSNTSENAATPSPGPAATPASPPGPATNFPFPPPFNPAMFGAHMPMMPGFMPGMPGMPPMMPQFCAMPGMAGQPGQSAMPQVPHPLVAAQMARMNPFWPMNMMNPAFQGQTQAGGQRSFQQMMEMMRSMQQQQQQQQGRMNSPASQPTRTPAPSASNAPSTSSAPSASQTASPAPAAPSNVPKSTVSSTSAAPPTTPASAPATATAPSATAPSASTASASTASASTPSASTASASTPSASTSPASSSGVTTTSSTEPAGLASSSPPTPSTNQQTGSPQENNTPPSPSTPTATPNSTTPTTSDNDLRQRRPAASPSHSNNPAPSIVRPPPVNLNRNYMSAELPTRTRSDNPFVVFLILVLGLAILALIIRRVYKFNLWNYDY